VYHPINSMENVLLAYDLSFDEDRFANFLLAYDLSFDEDHFVNC